MRVGSLAVGYEGEVECHACAMKDRSEVVCAESNRPDSDPLQKHLQRKFRQVSAGPRFACAAQIAGRAICWQGCAKGNDPASCELPSPPDTFVEISTGRRASCGRREDGTVRCWASPEAYSLALESCTSQENCGVVNPKGRRFKQISSGFRHTCGITTQDTIYCWGNNEYNELGAPRGRFKQVVSGRDFSCAMSAMEEVTCWGKFFSASRAEMKPHKPSR
jgi:alpha-tubulin suppressor-like RCC1 family protein